ncbi:hypothetical protein E6A44_018605 [Pedobacter ureilyticus]|uniref:Secreted protein n=2 Tax=Pedobacter ureilyticus TaxID=1393051 RepID=A0ABW9JCL2_9SPHI|nr:hypothetical protein [Pedobacter helvus]
MKAMINFILMIFIPAVPVCHDNKEISETKYLEKRLFKLKYPRGIERFYSNVIFDQVWISSRTWAAMMLTECVLQYGLSHTNYHPHQLVHGKLRRVFAADKVTPHERKAFNISI